VFDDFVTELSIAAKTVGAVTDESHMQKWASDWLKSAGCA
jgi:hypothetical protein